jgi:hypothetical protein
MINKLLATVFALIIFALVIRSFQGNGYLSEIQTAEAQRSAAYNQVGK